jgi:hypothetical protein
MEQQVCLMNP